MKKHFCRPKWIQPNRGLPNRKHTDLTTKEATRHLRISLSDLVVFLGGGISLIQGETFAPGPWYQKICIAILEVQKKWEKMKVFHWVDDFVEYRESESSKIWGQSIS